MPQLIAAPTRIPVPGGKVIDEYVGAVNTPSTSLGSSVSVAHMQAPVEVVVEENLGDGPQDVQAQLTRRHGAPPPG